jgi:hypothetical protein
VSTDQPQITQKLSEKKCLLTLAITYKIIYLDNREKGKIPPKKGNLK